MGFIKRIWNHLTVQRLVYFFPIQLLLVHVKKNVLIMFFWFLMTGFAVGFFGRDYGIPYLFWDPEYLGEVDFWSFLILGVACGGFIMAFHVSSYIMNAHRFPFLATLSKPFFKYSLNNSFLPALFLGLYTFYIVKFQYGSELYELNPGLDRSEQVVNQLLGFYAGILIFMFPGYSLLAAISRDVMNMFGIDDPIKHKRTRKTKPIKAILKGNVKWRSAHHHEENEYDWKVLTYLAHWFKIGLTRDSDHYDRGILKRVFEQNHLIAAIFEILILASFIILGAFRETDVLSIPTGATIFLVGTMLLMFTSAIYSRLRGWSVSVLILLLVFVHVVSKNNVGPMQSKAFGLNYDVELAPYDLDGIEASIPSGEELKQDVDHHIEILRKWKSKNTHQNWEKPKLVIICSTGGGARSALWAFRSIQYADSLSGGKLLDRCHLLTGASGGMFGLSYLRELKLRSLENDSIDMTSSVYATNVGKDLLNPVSTTLALNDLFVRWQSFADGDKIYTKDRGYSLERQWNENTGSVMNKRISDYQAPEAESKIPLTIMSPNILNDGRSLIIGSQPLGFMTSAADKDFASHRSAIEFLRFFKDQEGDQLWFTSALRMNATFPYISPAVSLPTNPPLEVMDAGFRDNYGINNALKYLFTFRNWISSNTSGVLIIQIRDGEKIEPVAIHPPRTFLNHLLDPVGNIYTNLFSMQDFNHDEQLLVANEWFDGELDVIDLEMPRPRVDDIALSWHLTSREKYIITQGVYSEKNQKAFQLIDSLIQH